MWLSRKRFDALVAEAAAEHKRREVLERNEALLRQHVDWLSAHVNRLEAERSLLLQRFIGLNLPAPIISPVAPAAASPASAGSGTPLSDDAREPVAGIDVGALMLGAAAFEDMGDDEAKRQGIHTEVIAALR